MQGVGNIRLVGTAHPTTLSPRLHVEGEGGALPPEALPAAPIAPLLSKAGTVGISTPSQLPLPLNLPDGNGEVL